MREVPADTGVLQPDRPARAPFVQGARRGPKLGDPCPACNEADLVQKGSKMGCPRPECWYTQPCCDGGMA